MNEAEMLGGGELLGNNLDMKMTGHGCTLDAALLSHAEQGCE